MKKLLISILSVFALCLFSTSMVIARADESANTDLYVPSTYVEYYSLEQPLDVWTDGTKYVICESKSIIYFDGELFEKFELPSYSISKVAKIDNFIIFLSGSRINTIDVTTKTITEHSEIVAGTSFYITDNVLVTNPSSEIRYYNLSTDDGFTAEELIEKRLSLGYSPTALLLTKDDILYYVYEGWLYKISQGTPEIIAQELTNTRAIDYGNGKIYISYENGIKVINANSGIQEFFLSTSSDMTLDKINHPRGIYYHSNNLYIADDKLNAILTLDTTKNALTDFFITSNHNAISRISAEANAIFATDTELLVLDKSIIKAVDLKTEEIREIKIPKYSALKFIASTNGTYLLSSGTNLILAKENSSGELEEIAIDGNLSRFENVSALATFEDEYFILNNETVNNEQKAVVYKLTTDTYKLTSYYSILGRGDNITTDVFGDLYIQYYNESDGKYYVSAVDITASSTKSISNGTEKIHSIFVDYEGNLFSLVDNNVIIKTSNGTTTRYNLELSQNLPLASAIDFATTQGNNQSYFLYKGYILNAKSEEIGISTPQKISVPDDFSFQLNENPTFVTLKNSAKLFEVTIDENTPNSEYFSYKEMSANTDTDMEYVLITISGRYSVILNDKKAAIVRTEDTVTKQVETTDTNELAYAVNDCNIYSYPVLFSYLKDNQLEKNELVSIKKTLKFNSTDYALVVSAEDKVGFLALSMLKTGIASNTQSSSDRAQTLSADTAFYSDEKFENQAGVIKKGTIVTILDVSNSGVVTAVYNNKVVYFEEGYLKDKSSQVIRNLTVIILCFIALFVTSIFLVKRLFASKLAN